MVLFARQAGAAIALLLALAAAIPRSSAAQEGAKAEVIVAAAANLTDVFRTLGPRFEAETGIHPTFNFASTAQLTQQIENAAPFDLLAAADQAHVVELDGKKLLTPGSRAVYAEGVLALWRPPLSRAEIKGMSDLTSPGVRVIAIAKPELAPYGQAAVTALQRAGIWDRVKAKVVYAENINMARQYGVSGNADAVFTAYALVLREPGVIRVDPKLHDPILQELGIVAASPHQAEARRFADFLLKGSGAAILAGFGYRVPGKR